MATILGPSGRTIREVGPGAPAMRGDWGATIAVNNETKQPVLIYICKVWRDGEQTQLQIAVENPPFTQVSQVLETIIKVENDALSQGYTFEQSEVAQVAQEVAKSGAKLVLQEFAR